MRFSAGVTSMNSEGVRPEGFEPSTFGLRGRCSAVELEAPESLSGHAISALCIRVPTARVAGVPQYPYRRSMQSCAVTRTS